MSTIERIEKGHYNLSEFTEDQINLIKGLVKLSYQDGFIDGKATTTVEITRHVKFK
jgi:hypothetical protein